MKQSNIISMLSHQQRKLLIAIRADTARRLAMCEIEIPYAETPREHTKLEALRQGLLYGVQLTDLEIAELTP